MTQPVAPGTRVACFEESPTEPIERSSSPPRAPSAWIDHPAWQGEGLANFELAAARAPPTPEPRTPLDPAGLRFCRKANTVVEGFLCDEPVVVSDACRKPNNSFDAYICDEPRMDRLQSTLWDTTIWVIKTLISLALARSKPR